MNNCYLNSSLQLLTRIEGLKERILSFKDKNINKNNITGGNLLKEFKIILEDIENNEKIISPDNLKKEMAKLDKRYKHNHQEDANEFISNFLDALREETLDKLSIKNKINPFQRESTEWEAYDKFYNKFYEKKGESFILDLFYGNYITKKFCKNCEKVLSVKFSAFNMIELPIYELAKNSDNLDRDEIIKSYFSKTKIDNATCDKCFNREVYTETRIFKLPQNLILFFGRTANDQYIDNPISYSETLNLDRFCDERCKSRNYYLDCVIEHSGYSDSGHYTALCRNENNTWFYFSDDFYHENPSEFYSENAIILLYA